MRLIKRIISAFPKPREIEFFKIDASTGHSEKITESEYTKLILQDANRIGIEHMERMIKHMKPRKGLYDTYLCNNSQEAST